MEKRIKFGKRLQIYSYLDYHPYYWGLGFTVDFDLGFGISINTGPLSFRADFQGPKTIKAIDSLDLDGLFRDLNDGDNAL